MRPDMIGEAGCLFYPRLQSRWWIATQHHEKGYLIIVRKFSPVLCDDVQGYVLHHEFVSDCRQ